MRALDENCCIRVEPLPEIIFRITLLLAGKNLKLRTLSPLGYVPGQTAHGHQPCQPLFLQPATQFPVQSLRMLTKLGQISEHHVLVSLWEGPIVQKRAYGRAN